MIAPSKRPTQQQVADKIKQAANNRIKKPVKVTGMKEKKVTFDD